MGHLIERGPVAFFGSGKDKKEAGPSELVMAYLEDAQRVRCPFLLSDKRQEASATIQGLDEDASTVTFNLSNPFAGGKGNKVDLVFVLDNIRLGGRGQLMECRSSLLMMTIPEELELMERRQQPRARLNPKEGATATALTGLFDGIGVTGVLESISESGCRLRVEKALSIRDEKRMHLGTALLSPGQPILLLKLNKVPKCPSVMELTGRVAYLSDVSGGLVMALIFDKLRVDYAAAIRSLVSSRGSAIPTSVPPKTRRKAQATEAPLLADPEERAARLRSEEEPISQERSAPPKPAAAPEPTPTPLAAAIISEVEEVPEDTSEKLAEPPRNPALLRLKKRTRTVLLMTPAGYGELLKGYLLDEGYGRVLIAANPQELEAGLSQSGLALVILDNGMPILESLEMVSELKEARSDLPPFILAAEDVSRALVLAAHRSGVSQLLVKPYPLDEAFSTLLEQQMGLL